MKASDLFATLSAGAEPIRVSPTIVLEEGPNSTVLLREKKGGVWTTARISMSHDKRLVAVARVVRK